MLKLFTDKKQKFICEINIQGDPYKNVTPRLVLTDSNNKNVFFEGKLEAGKCIIKVPALPEMSGKGKVQLELVVDTGLFIPWKSEFEINPSITKIEVKNIQIKTEDINTARDCHRLGSFSTIEKVKEEIQPEEVKKEIQPKVIKEVKKVKKQKIKKSKQIVKKNSKLFKENIIKDNKVLIIEILNVFQKLDEVSKVALIRQANSHKPSKKVVSWTNQIFCNPNSQYAKICIFEIDKFLKNKPNKKSLLVENLKKETEILDINYQSMI